MLAVELHECNAALAARSVSTACPAATRLHGCSPDTGAGCHARRAASERARSAGILPSKKRDDARHVAAATIGGAEVLVTWNYRHLVRPRKAEQFCAINLVRRYNPLLEISTPSEFVHAPREDD
jgi:hypothetical protein